LNGGGLFVGGSGPWYGAAGLRLHTPPTPLIEALHCCNVAKLQFGEVPSLNWAQYGAGCACSVVVMPAQAKTIATRIDSAKGRSPNGGASTKRY
jgi:hypothetical protein